MNLFKILGEQNELTFSKQVEITMGQSSSPSKKLGYKRSSKAKSRRNAKGK